MQGFEAQYQLLELDQTASLADIKQAYKDLVMVWHPDRFTHNARLRQKAEAKLKQFNDAYEYLKQWYDAPRQAPAKRAPQNSSPPRSKPSNYNPPPPKTDPRRSPYSPPPHVKTSGLYITFAHAEYVLKHYCFKLLGSASHPEYQSGPFVLTVSKDPLELTLSVPCHSLQGFDRILLSIPCKSTGHFCQAEAQQLLQLLQVQA